MKFEAPLPTVAASFLRRKDVAREHTIPLEPLEARRSDSHQSIEDVTESEEDPTYNPDGSMEFPEGGIKAYTVVFGSFMGLIPTFGLINSVGAIESYISVNQLATVSTSAISWIFTINFFITAASMIFSGALFDRNGSFGTLMTGSILFCGGLFATANATTMWQFLLTLGVVGLGNGICISPLCSVVSHYFNKKRAIALSFATTGGSVGGIVVPLMLRGLYPSVGFVWAIRILAFFNMFCLACALLTAKERFKGDQRKINTARDFLDVYVFDLFDYRALTEAKFVTCGLGVAFAENALIAASIYYPSYVIKRGFSEHTAYLLITVVNTTGILGRYIPGYLADQHLGRFNIAIATLVMCLTFVLTLWLPFGYNLNVLYAYSAIYGFFSGSILTLPPVLCGQISRTEEFGKRYSTMYMFVSIMSLAVVPVGGAIIGGGNIERYNHFIIYVGLLMAVGSGFYVVSRSCCVGWKLCKF